MSSSKKRKRSASLAQPPEEGQGGGAEQSDTLTSTDLMCCIAETVRQTQQCPVCKAAVPGVNALHPNCTLNDVVTQFRSKAAASKDASKGSHRVADILSLTAGLSQEELLTVQRSITERCQHSAEVPVQFQSFQELATLTYGDPASNCCIVSSIEFDRDGEFFAVAGVTKKIKIFVYESVVRNAGFTNHFPVHEMSCAAKLSCIAYNPYHKHHLVSSDYEGSVCVWDTNIGRRTALHQEHGQRVWSVAYNPQEPTLFASGSDDCTVKLWSMGQPNSIFSFSARANICSVKFNPHSRYMLAYGSADHGVHYVDLRSPNQPLLELQVLELLELQVYLAVQLLVVCAAPLCRHSSKNVQ